MSSTTHAATYLAGLVEAALLDLPIVVRSRLGWPGQAGTEDVYSFLSLSAAHILRGPWVTGGGCLKSGYRVCLSESIGQWLVLSCRYHAQPAFKESGASHVHVPSHYLPRIGDFQGPVLAVYCIS